MSRRYIFLSQRRPKESVCPEPNLILLRLLTWLELADLHDEYKSVADSKFYWQTYSNLVQPPICLMRLTPKIISQETFWYFGRKITDLTPYINTDFACIVYPRKPEFRPHDLIWPKWDAAVICTVDYTCLFPAVQDLSDQACGATKGTVELLGPVQQHVVQTWSQSKFYKITCTLLQHV